MANGLARSGFDKDLAFGESKESVFVKALQSVRVECKADQKCRKSSNIAIEIRQGSNVRGKGKPSGLSVTDAEWWAIEYADDCWIFLRTSKLKTIARACMQNRGTVMGGDDNRFELILIPIELLVAQQMNEDRWWNTYDAEAVRRG